MTSLMQTLTDLPVIAAVLLKVTILLTAGWLLHLALAGRNPRWRVLLWRLVMIGLVLLPPAEWLLPKLHVAVAPVAVPVAIALHGDESLPQASYRAPGSDASLPAAAAPRPSSRSRPSAQLSFRQWGRGHFAVLATAWWALVALVLALRLVLALGRLRRLVRETRPAPEWTCQIAVRVAADLHYPPDAAKLRATRGAVSPFAAGVRRPVVVLPDSILDPRQSGALPAILAHELAHLRGGDIAWMMLARWISVALWFHPLAWRLRRAHDAACEAVCDGVAAEAAGGALAYSRTLAAAFLELAIDGPVPLGAPMFRTSEITRRIRQIRRGIEAGALARRWVAAALVAGCIILTGLVSIRVVEAQQMDNPKTQAVTPAKNAPGGRTLNFPAGRSLGWISIRDQGDKAWPDWKQLGEAKGDVSIPAGKDVMLQVEGGGVDLSPLMKFAPDAIQIINLSHPTLTDNDLQFLGGLTGLHGLGISGGNPIQGAFTGAGLAYLKNLNRLEDLSITFTYLNDAGLANVKLLANLKSLTLMNDERLTGAGLASLKGLKSLRDLSFYMTPVTDQGMQQIKEMKWLESLGLEYANVTPAGVAAIAELSGLKSLSLYAKVPGSALAPLKGMSQLESLTLAEIAMKDNDLSALAGFSSLKKLDLRLHEMTGEGLNYLHALPKLEEVSLALNKATDASMKEIKGLKIKALNLDRSNVGDEGLTYLKGMTSLEHLFLSGTKITDAGLKNLANLSSLRVLRMDRTRITDQGLKYLKGLEKLGDLWISETQVGDASYETIGGFRQLGQLVADKTKVTDAGIKYLSQHPNLEVLDLDNTSVTDQSIQYVTDMPKLQTLGLGNTGLTDTGLHQLTQAKRLTQVSVDHTDVTAEGIASFKALRPECNVDGADRIKTKPARVVAVGSASTGNRNAAGERVLHFPAEKSMGQVQVRDKGVARDDWQSTWTQWETAKGDVKIPAGVDVALLIDDAGGQDLAPLDRLGADDLQLLDISSKFVLDMDLKHLKGLSGLKYLSLQVCDLDGSGFAQLKSLKGLEALRLGNHRKPLKDESMSELAQITSLRWLALWGTGISDGGLERLRPLKELRFLSLSSTPITDKGLAVIKGMTKLENLMLDGTKITDAGLDSLAGMIALKHVNLSNIGITDAGLARLKGLTRMEELWLNQNRITDEGMKTVAGMKGLKALFAWRTKITDTGLARLQVLKELNHITIDGTGDEGVATLSGLPGLKYLQIMDNKVTTASLESFRKMKGLELLYISGEGIDDAFIGRLKAALPGCRVFDPVIASRQTKGTPQNPQWAKKFYEVYRLEDGEVLKRIAPPFIPERLDYYRVERSGQATSIPRGPDLMSFRWDTKLIAWGMSFGSGGDLADGLGFVIGLPRYEYEGDAELLKLKLPGDWIVHTETPKAQLVAALEKIVNEQTSQSVHIERRRVERDVIVVRGSYAPHPIENYDRRGGLQIYVDKLNEDPGMGGGGSGPLKEFIAWVGSLEHCWMIDETASSTVQVSWHDNNDSAPQDDRPLAPDKMDRLLKNLTRQTGLTFKPERRTVEVWMVTKS